MAWLEDVIGGLIGGLGKSGGGSGTSVQQTSSQATSVTVNPTILNNIDTGPLAQPLQNLVDALTIGGAVQAAATLKQGEAFERGAKAIADAQGGQNKINELATLVSFGGLAIAVIKLFSK